MSSDNPISDAAEGVTKGLLEWSAEKISLFVKKLHEKKLAFIQDRKTIELVKEHYNSGEVQFYNRYIKDKELLLLIKIGLTLRKLENDEERRQNLRDKIFRKYKTEGLHIAEFVENGALNKYIGILLEELTSIGEFEKEVGNVLKNIDKHAIFVKGDNRGENIIKRAMTLSAHSPPVIIIAGVKSAAGVVKEIVDPLKNSLEDYHFERFSSGDKEILFFKKELPARSLTSKK